jgi:hypothetical protein
MLPVKGDFYPVGQIPARTGQATGLLSQNVVMLSAL